MLPIKLDGELMSKALLLARDEYWRAIVRWLRSKMDEDIEELVFCGGTADYIRPEIDAYLQKEGIKVSWHADIFIPDEISSGMGNRMADVYALHQHMITQLDKITGYVRIQEKQAPPEQPDNVRLLHKSRKFVPDYTPRQAPEGFLTIDDNV